MLNLKKLKTLHNLSWPKMAKMLGKGFSKSVLERHANGSQPFEPYKENHVRKVFLVRK